IVVRECSSSVVVLQRRQHDRDACPQSQQPPNPAMGILVPKGFLCCRASGEACRARAILVIRARKAKCASRSGSMDVPMQYVLTASCRDRMGIVAAVTTLLAAQACFIVRTRSFGDPDTGRFFLRIEFHPTAA